MTVTLVAAADEPPRPPLPPSGPVPGQPPPGGPGPVGDGPWWQPRYIAQHRRATNPIPRQRTAFCCELSAGGDVCDCDTDRVELARAFARPIVIDLRGRGAA